MGEAGGEDSRPSRVIRAASKRESLRARGAGTVRCVRTFIIAFGLVLAGCGDLEADRVCLGGCLEPSAGCVKYLECFNRTWDTPGTLDPTFGKRGACWSGERSFAELCTRSCETELPKLIKRFPDAGCSLP